ncbi:STM4015 family protein [Streptosporangium roseum]|uniref:STM4015 family protein n=1 Tax=Streptosporangium roseum TaxID=2001 RepID=UPI0004CCD00D|nr:STM4015 family protein [Streptosporangium roseum]
MTNENPGHGAVWDLRGDSYAHVAGEDGGESSIQRSFEDSLATRDLAQVREIVVGWWGPGWEGNTSELPVRLLSGVADRLPNVRSIMLGDIESEESEISWIEHGDVTPLLEAFPLLEALHIRGGSGLLLRPVRHEALHTLWFETGGLPGRVVRAVADSDLPALENLEMWLGVSDYGGDATVADLAPILSGERLPALRHLGLQDSEIQDEIAAAVASAPVVARLESLALSMGTLTDEGAEALLSGQPLTHLRRLDLHHHYLTGTMVKHVEAAFAGTGVEVDLSEQEEPDDDWRYVAVAE